MKRLFYLLIPLLMSVPVPGRAGIEEHWTVLPKVTTQNLNKLFFLDSLRGWVVGNRGTILKTTDGGESWLFQNAGIMNDLHEVFMLNENRGWALGLQFYTDTSWYGTYILETTNGGATWVPEQYPTNDLFYTVAYLDSLTGWMGGEYGVFVGTTDGGASWFPANVDSSICARWAMRRLKFFSPQIGVAVGGRIDLTGVVWHTTNGGQRWMLGTDSLGQCPGLEPLLGIHFVDSIRVITVGGDYDYGSGLVETTNGGATWEYRYLAIWGEARALSFRTAYEGWAPLGFAGTYMFTTDTGRTWTDTFTPDTSALYDLAFTDSLTGYAVGQSGTILKYDPTIVGVKQTPPFIPATTELRQNHPNPFNPSTNFEFRLSESGLTSLRVYDVLGREIATLVNEVKSPGDYAIVWDAKDVASGVYFYRLEFTPVHGTSAFIDVKKMVVVR